MQQNIILPNYLLLNYMEQFSNSTCKNKICYTKRKEYFIRLERVGYNAYKENIN